MRRREEPGGSLASHTNAPRLVRSFFLVSLCPAVGGPFSFAALHSGSTSSCCAVGALVGALLLGALAGPFAAHAQAAGGDGSTGAVAGVVVDGKTGETLPGANVAVRGTQRGTSTDMDGRYRIEGLAPGAYDLAFSFVSYRAKTVTGVEVTAGETAPLDVTLSAATQTLDEVVVTAEVARNSEAGLLKERQKAAGVSNAISAEAISASGSSDAADAMEKVTGASITEGKFVNVRGLGGRYVNTTLNGAPVPSVNPDHNAVPFDLFPAGLLQSIVTSKTFTPDMAGNFTGGNVDIGTVAFPSDLELSFSSSVGYNTAAGHGDNRYGFVGGLDEVPGIVPATGVPQKQLNPTPARRQQLDAITRAFGPAVTPRITTPPPVTQSYGASFGNEFSLFGGMPLGVVASASYDRNVSGYAGGRTARYPGSNIGDAALTKNLVLDDEATTVEDLYSGLANVSLRPAEGQELGARVLYTKSSTQRGRFQSGDVAREYLTSGDVFRTRTLHQTDRTVVNGQVRGEHVFGRGLLEHLFGSRGGFRFKWNGALTHTDQREPDYRQFADEVRQDGSREKISTSAYDPPTRYFRDLGQDGRSAQASLRIPLAGLDLKVGGSYDDRDRQFRQRRFIYYLGCSCAYDEQRPHDFFGPPNAGLMNGTDELGNFIQGSTNTTNSYNGAKTVTAGFAMLDVPLGTFLENVGAPSNAVLDRLRLIGGARAEHTRETIDVYQGDPDSLRYPLPEPSFEQVGEISQTTWLPSAGLVYGVTDAMNVRAAYGRTLARPSFREFAPIRFSRFIGDYDVIGNAGLRLTTVDNFDLRWEWFPSGGEVLAVSGFYKRFDGAIFRTFLNVNNPTLTFVNGKGSRVYGAEVEARKRLGFLSGALRGFKAGANLTLAHSRARIPTGQSTDAGNEHVIERSFQGQSPYLVNADLSYENAGWGTRAGLYYNVFGKRLSAITRDVGPDRFEQPCHTLDFTLSQRLPVGLSRLRLKLKAKNLLGAAHEIARTYRGKTYVVRRYALGRSFSLALKYSL